MYLDKEITLKGRYSDVFPFQGNDLVAVGATLKSEIT